MSDSLRESLTPGTTPAYDANGNLTTDQTGKHFGYDAWNRLVAVQDAEETPLASYGYDALHRRVTDTVAGTTKDLYYSSAWQVLEERVNGQATTQYVWSPVYIDALVLRDRDANLNVTALVDTAGNVVERYVYDPYGKATVLNANWTEAGSSASS